ncbi:MAG: FAD-dependent oxidoreductase [Deltaproteobacteria bacterium]|nr:FAD-dependent oxidoreductase [Deltaproteobacteria bacterium]
MPRILILGANFAGIAAARAIPASASLDVTVVDRSASFEWIPNIHELISRRRTTASLRVDRRRMVRKAGHRFVRAEVRELDPARGIAVTDTGRELRFDACIVATGGVHDDFGVRGAARHAMPFKSVADCDAIGKRLAELARQATRRVAAATSQGTPSKARTSSRSAGQPRTSFTVAIVGGGIEGIECLGEVLRSYGDHQALCVHVIEAAGQLLAGAPRVVDRAVRAHCAPYPVNFHMNTRVTAVTHTGVGLAGKGRPRALLAADIVIWNGGARPSSVLARAGLAGGPRQWAPVTTTLQSRRFPNVFVAGDAAALPRPISKQAYFALQMGAHAGRSAARFVEGLRPRAFHPAPKPMLIAFGELDTFLVGRKSVLAGTALALVKEGLLHATLAQLDPPTDTDAALALGRRAVAALRAAALPELLSIERLLRLPGIRVLR